MKSYQLRQKKNPTRIEPLDMKFSSRQVINFIYYIVDLNYISKTQKEQVNNLKVT